MTAARLCLLSLLVVGCGGTSAFTPTFPDNRATDFELVQERLSRSTHHASRSLVVGLTRAPETLYAFDAASGETRWAERVSPEGTPHIAGDYVLLHEGAEIVGRRLIDGRPNFRIPTEQMHFVGAAGEGDNLVVTLSTTGGVGAQSQLVLIREGAIQTTQRLQHALGLPAMRSGMAFVPWGHQHLTVLETADGGELARLVFHRGVISAVRSNLHGIFFGQDGVSMLTEAPGTHEGSWEAPDTQSLPGRPRLLPNAYEPPPGARSAAHKIRLVWSPAAEGEQVRFADDQLYLIFYRQIYALTPDLAVRWVYEHTSDLVGAYAIEGGLFVADANGGVVRLNAAGQLDWQTDSQQQPTVVRFALDGFAPESTPGNPTGNLLDQLVMAAESRDSRLVPARAFAVQRLASHPEPETTSRLITLCDEPQMPQQVHAAACAALAQRDNGGEAVLAALTRRGSYLNGTRTPPVGALGEAAARQGLTRAISMLLAHLSDPHTPTSELPGLLDAIGTFGQRNAAEALLDFMSLYHAEPESAALSQALLASARALLSVGGPVARDHLRELLDAPFTMLSFQQGLETLLTDSSNSSPE